MWKIYDELIESVPGDLMVSDCCVAHGISTLAGSVVTDARVWSFVRLGGDGMAIFKHGCSMVKISSSEVEKCLMK